MRTKLHDEMLANHMMYPTLVQGKSCKKMFVQGDGTLQGNSSLNMIKTENLIQYLNKCALSL